MKAHNSERVSDRLAGCDATVLAREFGTPLLVLDEMCLRSQMRRFRGAFTRVGWQASVTYAGKALLIAALARIANEEGLGVDVCSLGELETALRGGVPAKRCIVHGCFKTEDELDAAIAHGVGLVVIDHVREIGELAARARAARTTCDVLLRVNPGIPAGTHEFVRTAAAESKFGFAIADGQASAAVRATIAENGLRLAGIHCHLGSQINDLAAYAHEVDALVDFAASMRDQSGATLDIVNVGGGLAAGDDGAEAIDPEAWAQTIFGAFERRLPDVNLPRPHVYVEPGRAIVASCGTTLYRIGVRKRLPDGAQAIIVDGGMSDNPRPALYDARYRVTLVERPNEDPDGAYVVFGRHCETDRLFSDVALPDPRPGELLAVQGTGAYTYSMASNYNRFSRQAVVLASGGRARLIARREPLEHVLGLDVVDHP